MSNVSMLLPQRRFAVIYDRLQSTTTARPQTIISAPKTHRLFTLEHQIEGLQEITSIRSQQFMEDIYRN